MKMVCLLGKHSWKGCRCSICGKQRDEEHDWNQCTCRICGLVRHEYEVTARELIRGGGCKWDVDSPCTGPDCGMGCDSYYRGREGKYIITKKCIRCNETIQEEEYLSDQS